MKDIMLKIVGRQYYGEEEDQLEFVTEGQLYEKGRSTYVVYDESEFSGFPGCKTTLKLTDTSMKMRRFGEVGYGTEIVFEKGKRFSGKYETPYGMMDMEVLTNDLTLKFTDEGLGSVDIDYNVSISGVAEGRNRLNIEIQQ